MSTTVREFDLTETVETYVEVRNQLGVLVDPTSVSITITMPDGTSAVAITPMSNIGVGLYNYYYNTITQTGWYKVKITVVDTSKTTIKTGGFTVK